MEQKQKKKCIQIIVLVILITLFGVSIIFTSQISVNIKNMLYKMDIKTSKEDLIVHFINVGQGDAIAVTFPNDKVMLIDTGPKDSQNILLKYLKSEVFKNSNDMVIDYLILTHSDLDHAGGMCCVFEEFEVKNFFRPNIASASESAQDFAMQVLEEEYDEGIKLSQEEQGVDVNVLSTYFEFGVGDAQIQIMPPVKNYSTPNEMSCLTKITYKNKSFLFTGDIQGDSETDAIKYYADKLDADVLKVAHHGSKSSSSTQFLEFVSPQYAVISVGYNGYGHPNFETIANLENMGAEVHTTLSGDVRFVCGKEMFGVLKNKQTHSYEFVNWWIIALAFIIVLVYKLIKSTIMFVRELRCDKERV